MTQKMPLGPEVVYLVSAAGVPNFGDEFVTRSWLDWLARTHPGIDVWLDCIHPGRAAHLFRDTHPRLRVTNTLWELAHSGSGDDLSAEERRVRQLVREFGSPRVDAGIDTLRGVSSIHFLGGGYLNSLWRRNLGMVAAAVEAKEVSGALLFATGQGFLPQDEVSSKWMREMLDRFDYVESRDDAGAAALGVRAGIDDAFLAFATGRRVFREDDTPSFMLLLQGDFAADARKETLLHAVDQAVSRYAADGVFGVVEGMPPEDAELLPDLRERYPKARFYPFSRIWDEGLPARPGQTWLTSRFHFHLLAAAAGASGIALSIEPGYYDVKHGSLIDVGTGWALADGLDLPDGATADPAFVGSVSDLAARKAAIAELLYPRLRVTGIRSALARARGETFDRATRRRTFGAG